MTRNEFSRACKLAFSNENLENYDISILNGFGLKNFKRVEILLGVAARCIRWQCLCFNGNIDNESLEECRIAFKSKVSIIDQ